MMLLPRPTSDVALPADAGVQPSNDAANRRSATNPS